MLFDDEILELLLQGICMCISFFNGINLFNHD